MENVDSPFKSFHLEGSEIAYKQQFLGTSTEFETHPLCGRTWRP